MVVGFMADQHRLVHSSRTGAVLQVSDDVGVGVENLLALVIGDSRVEAALGVHGSDRGDADGVGGGLVVLAVGRCHVHDPGAVLGRDELPAQYLECIGGIGEVGEWRQVAQSDQLLTGVAPDHRGVLPQFAGVRAEAFAGNHQPTAVSLDDDIVHFGVDRHGLVGRQRPRCGGPDQQVGAVEVGIFCGDGESDGDSRVLAALVDVIVHPQLVAGQRSLVVPAVRQHPNAFIRQTFVPEFFERPDDRLHEGKIEGLVVIVEIHPARLPGHVGPPLGGVLENRISAGIVEHADTHLFDLRFVGDTELALHLEFGRQSVGVPTEPAFHPVAPHGAIAGNDVLDVSGQQMAIVR